MAGFTVRISSGGIAKPVASVDKTPFVLWEATDAPESNTYKLTRREYRGGSINYVRRSSSGKFTHDAGTRPVLGIWIAKSGGEFDEGYQSPKFAIDETGTIYWYPDLFPWALGPYNENSIGNILLLRKNFLNTSTGEEHSGSLGNPAASENQTRPLYLCNLQYIYMPRRVRFPLYDGSQTWKIPQTNVQMEWLSRSEVVTIPSGSLTGTATIQRNATSSWGFFIIEAVSVSVINALSSGPSTLDVGIPGNPTLFASGMNPLTYDKQINFVNHLWPYSDGDLTIQATIDNTASINLKVGVQLFVRGYWGIPSGSESELT